MVSNLVILQAIQHIQYYRSTVMSKLLSKELIGSSTSRSTFPTSGMWQELLMPFQNLKRSSANSKE